jgi:hypothetical protein
MAHAHVKFLKNQGPLTHFDLNPALSKFSCAYVAIGQYLTHRRMSDTFSKEQRHGDGFK